MGNLVEIYFNAGKHKEAERLCRRSLAIYEAALGRDHADVAWCLQHLASMLQQMGRHAEANELIARAKAIFAKHGKPNR